jgi:serine/threonine protein phosphatase 1
MARYAIGDIHGCVETFKKLVREGIELKKDDTLYLLGDLVNKGPDSRGVIDFIFELQKQDFDVVSLKGNHDQMLLSAFNGNIADYWKTEHGEPKTLKSFGVTHVEEIPDYYFDFIRNMPLFLELDHFFLVHAGFNFSTPDFLSDFKAMLHTRRMQLKPDMLNGKRLIHGHVPVEWNKIEIATQTKAMEINLDCGCVYYLNEGLGFLVGMDLDSFQLFKQENIDKPYSIDIKKQG